MAFLKKNFQPAGGQAGRGMSPQIHAYRTTDAHAVVDTSGYFNSIFGLLELGDLIYVTVVDNVDTPTSVTTAGFHVVKTKVAATLVVDVTDVLALTMTNTD